MDCGNSLPPDDEIAMGAPSTATNPLSPNDDGDPPISTNEGYSHNWYLSNLMTPQASPGPEGIVLNAIRGLAFGSMENVRWCGSDDSVLPLIATPEIFPSSCMAHDNCYSNAEAVKQQCDSKFLSNMLQERPGLIVEALIFYGAVTFGGQSSFDQGQSSWSSDRKKR